MANANPYISIAAANNGEVKLNKTGNLIVICGNAGVDTIPANSLEVTISVGNNAKILSVSKVAASDHSLWKVKKLPKDGSYIKLVNKYGFEQFDLSQIILNVKGISKGGPNLCAAHVGYIFGKGEDGKWFAQSGNASWTDDNSLTSFTVV